MLRSPRQRRSSWHRHLQRAGVSERRQLSTAAGRCWHHAGAELELEPSRAEDGSWAARYRAKHGCTWWEQQKRVAIMRRVKSEGRFLQFQAVLRPVSGGATGPTATAGAAAGALAFSAKQAPRVLWYSQLIWCRRALCRNGQCTICGLLVPLGNLTHQRPPGGGPAAGHRVPAPQACMPGMAPSRTCHH